MSANDGGTEGNRRSSHVEMPVAYAAVGATKAPDLLRFPPEGSSPYEEELRLGSGNERFILASSLLMTWGAQRGAGIPVDAVERGPDDEYEGVVFDAEGRAQAAGPREDFFGPDGEPYLNAGTTAMLGSEGKGARRILVVYTVNEDRRVGFAWGTCDEDGPTGEQRIVVEHRDDDTVWAVARGFLTPTKGGLLGLKARSDLKAAIELVRKQMQALTPGGAIEAVAEGPAAALEEPAKTAVPAEAEEPAKTAIPVVPQEHEEPQETEEPQKTEQPQEREEPQDESADPQPETGDAEGGSARLTHQRRPSRPANGE